MKKIDIRSMVITAICSATIAVCAQVAIHTPSGIPITMQTFAIAFTAYLLGSGWGTASVGVYLLMGAAGIPVFAGFRGGAGMLFSYTAGFLWGFLPMAALCGWKRDTLLSRLLLGFTGLVICHASGVTVYSFLSSRPWTAAFLIVSLPYLPKDVLSLVGAALLAPAVIRVLRLKTGIS